MIKQQRGSVKQIILLLHDLMKINRDDKEIQKEFQRTINILFQKFPDEMPIPK